jgi:hypothetical protein
MKTELCNLFEKYKADKCPAILHTYSPIYFKLLKDIRMSAKNILEIGIGTIPIMTAVGIKDYVPGASIRGWRDFFPNATIYAVDIEESVMFTDDRIITDVVDQSSVDSIRKFTNKVNKKFDFIIDDGSHLIDHMIISAYELTNSLNDGGIYIIEDIHQSYLNIFNEIEFPGLVKIYTHCGTKDSCDNFIAYRKSNKYEIPKILHMVWVGENKAPQYFWDNLNKWKSLMPNWKFMVWTNDKLTTDYFEEDHLVMLKNIIKPSYVSDFIRFYVLQKWGGFYLDADVTPLRNLEELPIEHSIVLCNDLPENNPNYMMCAFIAGVQNHPVWEMCIDDYIKYSNDPEELNGKPVGPIIFGRVIGRNREWLSNDYIELPYWFFYRNQIGDPGPYLPDRVMRNHPDAFGNHFYASTWV